MAQAANAARAIEQANINRSIDQQNGTTNGIVTAEGLNSRVSAMQSSPGPHTSIALEGVPGALDVGQSVIRALKLQAQSESSGIAGLASNAYSTGGIAAALAAIKAAPDAFGATSAIQAISSQKMGRYPGVDTQALLGAERSTISDKISTYDQLVQLQNSQTTDKNAQAANIGGEVSWLKTLSPSIEVAQKIADLTKTMEDLISSTDDLTKSNGDLLSPYYSQDPRTSHIGFRSQGMASGGEFTVPGGYSANDNMIGTIPLASGEIVSVRRPGQSAGGQSVTINLGGITVNGGGDANAIGKTVYQALQDGAKRYRAASQ